MSISVLTFAQQCAKRLQLPSPSSFIGSTDNNMLLLRAMIEQAGQELRTEYHWPELQKEYSFTLATSTASYLLPDDMDSILTETWWNQTQKWPLIGPLDPQSWQLYKSGLITTLPRQRFRIKNFTTKQLYIDPTPSSSENGQTIVFEYITKSWCRPVSWAASTSWLNKQFCAYNGNFYDRGGTGAATTGTTAPTHTSGAVSDGSITWTYFLPSTEYTYLVHDSDIIILDQELMLSETIWRFKRERGLDFEELRAKSTEMKEIAKSKLQGASVQNIGSRIGFPPVLGIQNYPEGSW